MAESKPETFTGLNIYQKLAKITGEIGIVAKDGKNAEQKYAFIEYAAVAGKLRTLFAKYGVVIVPRIKSQERTEITSKYGAKGFHTLAKLEFQVVNADDPSDSFMVDWESEAADYGDKATNKAATAALKYYEMRQFNISEKGEDADEVTPTVDQIAAAPKAAESADAAPTSPTRPLAKPAVGSAPAPQTPDSNMASEAQRKMIYAVMGKKNVPAEEMHDFLVDTLGVKDTHAMSKDEARMVIDYVLAMEEWS